MPQAFIFPLICLWCAALVAILAAGLWAMFTPFCFKR